MKGDTLGEPEKAQIAKRLSDFTGLDENSCANLMTRENEYS